MLIYIKHIHVHGLAKLTLNLQSSWLSLLSLYHHTHQSRFHESEERSHLGWDSQW